MPRWLLLFFTGGFFFTLFILFSFLVHKDLFTTLDFNTTVRLQDNIGRNWDREFSWFSELGSFEVMLIFLIALFVLLRKWVAGVIALILFGVFHLIELFGKYFVDHPPPMQFMVRTKDMVDFPQFHVRSEFSYPSGHAGRAAFLSAILLVLLWQTKKIPVWAKLLLTGAIIGYDLSMFVSRVTLGEHWTTDVIGGALLGAGLGFIAASFFTWHNHWKQKRKSSKHH